MQRTHRNPSLLPLVLLVAGCGGKVDFIEGSGTGSSGTATTGSTGVGGATSHTVAIEVDQVAPTLNGDTTLVLLNHADGALVQSWLASELPVNVLATDGDVVTYAYPSGVFKDAGEVRKVVSFRVTPDVKTIRHHAEAPFAHPTPACATKKMIAHVHVPEIPGASAIMIHVWPGSGSGGDFMTPTVIDVPITSCGDVVSLFTRVDNNASTVVAFQLDQNLPLVDGSEIDLTIAGKNEPRTPLTVNVDNLDGVTSGMAFARWDGTYLGYPLFFTSEFALDQTIQGPTPFVFSTNQVDLPLGIQLAEIGVYDAAAGTSCAGAGFRRYGRSDTPLAFHAHALAAPIIDGMKWKLGPGSLGDEVLREFELGPLYDWLLHEDPTAPTLDAVYPVFPATVPDVLKDMPNTPPVFASATHVDAEEVAGYAAIASSAKDVYPIAPATGATFPLTTRVRWVAPCP